MWGAKSERYEAIISGLKAKHELDAMSRPDWIQVEAQQNRRRNEIMQAVFAMKRESAILLQLTPTTGKASSLTLSSSSSDTLVSQPA